MIGRGIASTASREVRYAMNSSRLRQPPAWMLCAFSSATSATMVFQAMSRPFKPIFRAASPGTLHDGIQKVLGPPDAMRLFMFHDIN